ncbi:hypothetical protein AKJ36_00015 [candidate division MSBL1 archaeon SCGC-AAA259I07]|uniref:Peptidase M48 domain-containing protein n=1 Tax=candidate division MSBL1 archaeon SCGC-AAA259I07 TaxID=1698266 RepID=A0A133UN44_9EURY|nr:hypothetical protein AKJ36_00015 [candidate division MSBL1 archaeon SCGC-AAA259I07]
MFNSKPIIVGRVKRFAEENGLRWSKSGENEYQLQGRSFLDFIYKVELEGKEEGKYALQYSLAPRKMTLGLFLLSIPFLFLFLMGFFISSIPQFSIFGFLIILIVIISLISITRVKRGFWDHLSSLDTYLTSYRPGLVLILPYLLFAVPSTFFLFSLFSDFLRISRMVPILSMSAVILLPILVGPLFFLFRRGAWSGVRFEYLLMALLFHSAFISPLFVHSVTIERFWSLQTSFPELLPINLMTTLFLTVLFIGFCYFFSLESKIWEMDEGSKITKKMHKDKSKNLLPYLGFPVWFFSSVVIWLEILYVLKFFLYGSWIGKLLPVSGFYPRIYWQTMEKSLASGHFLGEVLLVLYFALPFYFVFKSMLYRSKADGKPESKNRIKGSKEIEKLASKISEELDMKKPEVTFLKESEMKARSNSKGLIRLKHTLKLSKGLVENLERREIEAVLYHEFYHLKKNTRLKNFLLLLSRITFFGRGSLAGLIGFTSEEYFADEFAARKVGEGAVKGFLRKFRKDGGSKSRKQGESEVSKEKQEESGFLRDLNDRFVEWKKQLYMENEEKMESVFFGEIPTYGSPTYRERIENLEKFRGSIVQSS